MERLSGKHWVKEFVGSNRIGDLNPDFGSNVRHFISALEKADARVSVNAAFRPPERAYLMHWSWKIYRRKVEPQAVPSRANVDIKWVHDTQDKSLAAAAEMVAAFGMTNLNVAPSLRSRHTEGKAIDMAISWSGILIIEDNNKKKLTIRSFPKDGMNKELHEVGKTFGVIKYRGGISDKPHWSSDGR
ncbi:peptidoglycan-binding domain-containing protein [Erwinia sp. 198]|uniref:peptidoglycan-binding domain-containing protein n=1 Tax=Erwinia sp. 198 TaxID=2022746 RepID=UPI000F67026E|nr:peptidoglycan-binding domain-containing protein [Erwinia sp. 198]RRZ91005.1 peptidoglycan-binding domain-containing protein [Erwinia sp. 198]